MGQVMIPLYFYTLWAVGAFGKVGLCDFFSFFLHNIKHVRCAQSFLFIFVYKPALAQKKTNVTHLKLGNLVT
jgi:hypothetical protein